MWYWSRDPAHDHLLPCPPARGKHCYQFDLNPPRLYSVHLYINKHCSFLYSLSWTYISEGTTSNNFCFEFFWLLFLCLYISWFTSLKHCLLASPCQLWTCFPSCHSFSTIFSSSTGHICAFKSPTQPVLLFPSTQTMPLKSVFGKTVTSRTGPHSLPWDLPLSPLGPLCC